MASSRSIMYSSGDSNVKSEAVDSDVNAYNCSCNQLFSLQLLLMKLGGRIIYFGPVGQFSSKVIEYFEVIFLSIFFVSVLLPITLPRMSAREQHCLLFWFCQVSYISTLNFLLRVFLGCLRLRTSIIQQHGC